MAAVPDGWNYELFVTLYYSGFELTYNPDKIYIEDSEYIPSHSLPIANVANVQWYFDSQYTIPVLTTPFYDYIIDPDDGKTTTFGGIVLYGRAENSSSKLSLNFKIGDYTINKFSNDSEFALDHVAGTIYLAKSNLTSHLFYDTGDNFLPIVPASLGEKNGGVGPNLVNAPPYAALIQNAEGTAVGYINPTKGAYHIKANNESPQFGTLPIDCGGTGKTSFTANNLIYSNASGELTTNHYANATQIHINGTSAPDEDFNFQVSGGSRLNGIVTIDGNTTIEGEFIAKGTQNTFETPTGFNEIITVAENITYGTSLPASGTEGQIFFKLIN